MIIATLLNLILVLLKFAFGWINLPGIPVEADTAICNYLDLVFDNLTFLNFFVRPSTLKIVASSAIILYTFSKAYKVFLWIWHKLPISSN